MMEYDSDKELQKVWETLVSCVWAINNSAFWIVRRLIMNKESKGQQYSVAFSSFQSTFSGNIIILQILLLGKEEY